MYASYNYAACLQQVDRRAEAVDELKSLYRVRQRVLGPTHLDTLWVLWRLTSGLSSLDRNAEAVDLLNEAAVRRIDDGSTSNFTLLASGYENAGDHDSAIKWAQRTADLQPDDARAAYIAAGARLWNGDERGYLDACRRMVNLFASGDGDSKFWVVWSCGLAPPHQTNSIGRSRWRANWPQAIRTMLTIGQRWECCCIATAISKWTPAAQFEDAAALYRERQNVGGFDRSYTVRSINGRVATGRAGRRTSRLQTG